MKYSPSSTPLLHRSLQVFRLLFKERHNQVLAKQDCIGILLTSLGEYTHHLDLPDTNNNSNNNNMNNNNNNNSSSNEVKPSLDILATLQDIIEISDPSAVRSQFPKLFWSLMFLLEGPLGSVKRLAGKYSLLLFHIYSNRAILLNFP